MREYALFLRLAVCNNKNPNRSGKKVHILIEKKLVSRECHPGLAEWSWSSGSSFPVVCSIGLCAWFPFSRFPCGHRWPLQQQLSDPSSTPVLFISWPMHWIVLLLVCQEISTEHLTLAQHFICVLRKYHSTMDCGKQVLCYNQAAEGRGRRKSKAKAAVLELF